MVESGTLFIGFRVTSVGYIYIIYKGIVARELMVMGLKPDFLFGWLAPIYRRLMIS